MAKRKVSQGSRKVYTSGLRSSDLALEPKPSTVDRSDAYNRRGNFRGVSKASPSQQYTFQRGMAWAALQLPESEQIMALGEVLAMLGLQDRIMPKWRD